LNTYSYLIIKVTFQGLTPLSAWIELSIVIIGVTTDAGSIIMTAGIAVIGAALTGGSLDDDELSCMALRVTEIICCVHIRTSQAGSA